MARSEALETDRGDVLERLTIVFETPSLLAGIHDYILAQSFWDPGSNDSFRAIRDEKIEWPVRLRFIQSVATLFREFFALQRSGPLAMVCYMWWELSGWWIPVGSHLSPDRVDTACFECLRAILTIPHEECRRAAPHGLGHWYRAYAREVEVIIDELLAQPGLVLTDELREYAADARTGMVQ